MHEIMKRIGEVGIVPVIKLESADKAVPLGKALVAGGVPVAEVTFRTACAPESIAAMAARVPGLLVGAGTVTTAAQAKAALDAGARFVVCPAWDDAVVDFCLERGLPVLPGVSGPDGVARGAARGLEVLKFFPAEAAGGVPMLDALAGPFGNVRFVPTGGIDAANVGAYARRPQVHAIGGSWMVKADMVESGDWAGIERLCREAVLALHGFAFAHMGANGAEEAEARKASELFSSLFGFAAKEGNASIFASESIELAKKPYPGAKGHIGIRCNDVERAVARFRDLGIDALPDTAKSEKGKLKAIYLKLDIMGFAIHLLRA